MKNMFFLLFFLPFFASAQVYDADKLLDKAVEAMKNVTAGNNVANAQAVIEGLTPAAE